MKKFPVAIQLFSLRDVIRNDFEGILKSLKKMGYDGVEFAGLYGRTPKQISEICEEIGLIPISAHVTLEDMIKNENILEDYALIGCKYIAIPF